MRECSLFLLLSLLRLIKEGFDIFSPYKNTRHENVYNNDNKADSTAVPSSFDEIMSLSNKMIPLKTGTTIVGLCCRDGVVLGADTRSTGGPLVMDKNKLKIHKIANLIYCCAAGTSADCDHITRETAHLLSLLRLENELSLLGTSASITDDNILYDPIPAALQCIFKSLQTPRAGNQMKSSVMIVGGVDDSGPSLHMVDVDGVPTKVSFAALGSGSTDAIAVLENFLFHYYRNITAYDHSTTNKRMNDRHYGDNGQYRSILTTDMSVSLLSVSEGIAAVRTAVSAGIINDLGSGSHIDLCVIEQHGATQWREVSTQQPPQQLLVGSVSSSLFNTLSNHEDDNSQIDSPLSSPKMRIGRLILSNNNKSKIDLNNNMSSLSPSSFSSTPAISSSDDNDNTKYRSVEKSTNPSSVISTNESGDHSSPRTLCDVDFV